jgi:hypothetical protein
MVEAIEAKGKLAKNKDNPTGYLLVAAARLFETETRRPAGAPERKSADSAQTFDQLAGEFSEWKKRRAK